MSSTTTASTTQSINVSPPNQEVLQQMLLSLMTLIQQGQPVVTASPAVNTPSGSTISSTGHGGAPTPGASTSSQIVTLQQAMSLPSIKIPQGITEILKTITRIDDSILQKEKRVDLEQFILAFASQVLPAIKSTAYTWQAAFNQTLNQKVEESSQLRKLLAMYGGKSSFEEFAIALQALKKPDLSRETDHFHQLISGLVQPSTPVDLQFNASRYGEKISEVFLENLRNSGEIPASAKDTIAANSEAVVAVIKSTIVLDIQMSMYKNYFSQWNYESGKPREAQPMALTQWASNLESYKNNKIKLIASEATGKWTSDPVDKKRKSPETQKKGFKRQKTGPGFPPGNPAKAKKGASKLPAPHCLTCGKQHHGQCWPQCPNCGKRHFGACTKQAIGAIAAMNNNMQQQAVPQYFAPQQQQYYPQQQTFSAPAPQPYYSLDSSQRRREEEAPPSTSSESAKEKQKGKRHCMYLHQEDNNILKITGLINKINNPGGGEKIIVTTSIHLNSELIPIRIWVDNGSQATILAREFQEKHGIPLRKGPDYKLMGFGGGIEIINDISDLIVVINNNKVVIPALVSDSSILLGSDLLLGADQLGKDKNIAFYMPTDSEPFLVADKTFTTVQVALIKARIPEIENSKNDTHVESRVRFRIPEFPINLDKQRQEVFVDTTGVRETSSMAGNPFQLSKDSRGDSVATNTGASAVPDVSKGREKSSILRKRKGNECRDKASPQSQTSEIGENSLPMDIEGAAVPTSAVKKKKFLRSHSKRDKKRNRTLRKDKALQRKEQSRNSKLRKKFLKGIPRYNPSEIPNRTLSADIIACIADKIEDPHCSLDEFKVLMTAIECIASSPLNPVNSVEWYDTLPNSEELYIQHTLNEEQSKALEACILNCKDNLVEGSFKLGKAKVDPFDVELIPDGYNKLSKKRPRAYSLKGDYRDLLKKNLEEMQAAGVGQIDPPDLIHASPCFFAKRPRSTKLRLCYACTDLNEVTVDLVFPLPRMEDILDKLKGKRFFTILDLRSGYWQIILTDRAKRLMGMITQLGTFGWNVLPFGPKNAPAHFQRVMRKVLAQTLEKFALVYIDDIIIFSDSFEDHIKHIKEVFQCLKTANLMVAKDKAHFCLKQVKLLGKVVTGEGMIPDPAIIADVNNFPTPKNAKQVLRFLGLAGVYQNFIKDYQLIAAPLYKLTHKKVQWKWEKEEIDSFTQLKEKLISEPILHHPDFSKDFIIFSDASKIGAGAVLCQIQNEQYFPVAYASWLFSPTQRRYSTTEREMLALILAVRKWKGYFLNRKFLAKTDHKALTGYMNLHDPHGRIARWTAELNQFSFKLQHVPGKTNIMADALSRVDQDQTNQDKAIHTMAAVLADIGKMYDFEICAAVDLLTLPSDKEWAAVQRLDPDWYPLIRWIDKGDLPQEDKRALEVLTQATHFVLYGENDILMRKSKIDEDENETLRKVVPSIWRKLILTQYHDAMFKGAHAGRDKTLENVKSHFFFKNMAKYVDTYVKSCFVCQRVKDPSFAIKSWTPLGNIEAKAPLELYCIDLWSPGTRSRSGNIYVLTVIDAFSKWAFAIPIPNKNADTVAQALLMTFTQTGIPVRIHSDLGTEFINATLAALCSKLGIQQSNTTAYHPQGNAYAERIHKFFRQAIASYCLDDGRNWDELLPFLIMTYNDSYHSAIGCTPSEVHLGRRLGAIPLNSSLPQGDYTQLGFAERLDYILAKSQNLVLARQIDKLRRNDIISSQLGGGRTPTIFKKDDKVLLFRPVVHPESPYKITPHWFGPYLIDKGGHQNKVYYLKDMYGVPLKLPVSILRLKEFIERENEEVPMEKYPEEILHWASEDHSTHSDPIDISEPFEDEPVLDMEWNNPNEEFVPIQNPLNASQEELEILKSLNSDKTIKSRLPRPKKKILKLNIPRADSRNPKRIVRKFT